MPNHSTEIARIRAILREGASTVTTDGTTVTYDLAALRRELRQLEAEDDTTRGRRPVAASINLGGW